MHLYTVYTVGPIQTLRHLYNFTQFINTCITLRLFGVCGISFRRRWEADAKESHQAEYSMCQGLRAMRFGHIEIETNEWDMRRWEESWKSILDAFMPKIVNFSIFAGDARRTLTKAVCMCEFETEIDPFCFVTERPKADAKENKKKESKIESNWKQYTKVVHNFWRVCYFGILLRRRCPFSYVCTCVGIYFR